MDFTLSAKNLFLKDRLFEINLDVFAREYIAVIGPNGAGKSTLLRALAGLLRVSGEIYWQDRSLSHIPYLERGRMLSWIGQESNVDFSFSVRDVVAQGRFAHGDDDFAVEESMKTLDITHIADRSITELSGGERRRVFIARALATKAPIQLWDEPTSSLDVRHALEVYALANNLSQNGFSLLITLHDIRQAYRFSRVLVLDKGKIVADGSPHDVLTAPLLYDIFRVKTQFLTSLVPALP